MRSKSLNFKVSLVVAILIVGALATSYVGITKMDMLNMAITDLV